MRRVSLIGAIMAGDMLWAGGCRTESVAGVNREGPFIALRRSPEHETSFRHLRGRNGKLDLSSLEGLLVTRIQALTTKVREVD